MPTPAHIRTVRDLVGTELLLVPSVAVLARDAAGRVLLVENVEGRQWTLPGGLLEPDERPDAAAARESGEETGLDIAVGPVLGVFGGPQFRQTYANGDRIAVMVAVYAGEVLDGVEHPDGEETTAVAWFAPDELAGIDLSPRARIVLGELL